MAVNVARYTIADLERFPNDGNGRVLTMLLSNAHLEIDGIPCLLNTGTDLTQRRASEAQAAEDGLRRANEQKDHFLALLSHELRNPLTPILYAARVLEERVDADA